MTQFPDHVITHPVENPSGSLSSTTSPQCRSPPETLTESPRPHFKHLISLRGALCHLVSSKQSAGKWWRSFAYALSLCPGWSTLRNTCCGVRLNFILQWLADNSDSLTEKWRILPCVAFQEKPLPHLKWISLRTFPASPAYQHISQACCRAGSLSPAPWANGRTVPGGCLCAPPGPKGCKSQSHSFPQVKLVQFARQKTTWLNCHLLSQRGLSAWKGDVVLCHAFRLPSKTAISKVRGSEAQGSTCRWWRTSPRC